MRDITSWGNMGFPLGLLEPLRTIPEEDFVLAQLIMGSLCSRLTSKATLLAYLDDARLTSEGSREALLALVIQWERNPINTTLSTESFGECIEYLDDEGYSAHAVEAFLLKSFTVREPSNVRLFCENIRLTIVDLGGEVNAQPNGISETLRGIGLL